MYQRAVFLCRKIAFYIRIPPVCRRYLRLSKNLYIFENGCLALLALPVLHRAKLLASNQSILALGVAPKRIVSRWCRCVVQRLCATDCKRPCLVRAAAPHSAPARMLGVYAQRLCTMQSQQSIHSPSPRGRGLGFRQGCRDRTPKGFMQGCIQVVEYGRCRTHRQQTTTIAETQSPQSVLIGIENLLYFHKNRLFLQTELRPCYRAELNVIQFPLYVYYC